MYTEMEYIYLPSLSCSKRNKNETTLFIYIDGTHTAKHPDKSGAKRMHLTYFCEFKLNCKL